MFWKCRCCGGGFVTHRLYDESSPPVRQWTADQAGDNTPSASRPDEYDVRDIQVDTSTPAIYVSADNSGQGGNLVRYDELGNEVWRSQHNPTDNSLAAPGHVNKIGVKADGTAVANVRATKIYVLESSDGSIRWSVSAPPSQTRMLGLVWDGDDVILSGHTRLIKYNGATGATIWTAAISTADGGPIPFGDNFIFRWTNAILVDGVLYQLYIGGAFSPPFTCYLLGIDPSTGVASIAGSGTLSTVFPGIAYAFGFGLVVMRFRLVSYSDGDFGVGYAVGSTSSYSTWRFAKFSSSLSISAAKDFDHLRDYDVSSTDETFLISNTASGNVFGYLGGNGPSTLYKCDTSMGETYSHEISSMHPSGEIVRAYDESPIVGGPRVSTSESE